MSKKQGTVWHASPHTLAKIAILRSYLEKWFSILGSTFAGKNLWYVDGFAGPGAYEDGQDGSPIAAVKAANKARILTKDRWKAGGIRCVFIEEDAGRFANLESCLSRCALEPGIAIEPMNKTFVEGIAALREKFPDSFISGDPIFAFVDPFGAKGMPFSVVKELLTRRTAEVLINLDSDGINRIYAAGEHADRDRLLTEVFGDNSWMSLRSIARTHERMHAILALYKSKLLAIPGVRYAFSFEMRSANSSIDYHLVFASQHSLGS
jgi:three-Cys-motif partner protein